MFQANDFALLALLFVLAGAFLRFAFGIVTNTNGGRISLRYFIWLTALVGAACGIVGYEWRIVQEKREVCALVQQRQYPANLPLGPEDQHNADSLLEDFNLHGSLIRDWLGEPYLPGLVVVLAKDTPADEVQRMRDAFPDNFFYVATGK